MSPEELFELHNELPAKILNKIFKNPLDIARKKRLEYDDLLQYGRMGLWRACLEFDETKKVKFTSFAINHIRWNIFTQIAQESVFRRYKGKLHKEEGNAVEILDMDSTPYDDIDDKMTFHDMIPSDTNVVDDVMGNELHNYIFSKVNKRQKSIMELKLKELTLREIGSKLKISKELVRLELLKVRNIVNEFYGEVELV